MISIQSQLTNEGNQLKIQLTTQGVSYEISLPAKENGKGSKTNGGEALFLALAICYYNDIYREASSIGVDVKTVEVQVSGDFDNKPGAVAENIKYSARVKANAPKEKIEELMRHTDTVAEIHNTLRKGVQVELAGTEAVSLEA